jgi:hypothetical protein
MLLVILDCQCMYEYIKDSTKLHCAHLQYFNDIVPDQEKEFRFSWKKLWTSRRYFLAS